MCNESLAEANKCLLSTTDLTLRYGSYLAVDRLSLNVPEGKIYGFLGRNGAGKTSTIRMMMGIVRPDHGTIQFCGRTIQRIGNKEKQQIGYVSQEQFFYPWMKCQRLGKFVSGFFPDWDAREFDRLLDVLDLPANRKVAHLSGGMKVKLALALALSHRPRILILDEPTAGLDPVARREFLDVIRSQADHDGRTTFFSSHLIDEVERVADRVGVIHQGRLRYEGDLDLMRRSVRYLTADRDQFSQAYERLCSWGLSFLRHDADDPRRSWFQGSPEAWAVAETHGWRGTTSTLEDAFIAMASEQWNITSSAPSPMPLSLDATRKVSPP